MELEEKVDGATVSCSLPPTAQRVVLRATELPRVRSLHPAIRKVTISGIGQLTATRPGFWPSLSSKIYERQNICDAKMGNNSRA